MHDLNFFIHFNRWHTLWSFSHSLLCWLSWFGLWPWRETWLGSSSTSPPSGRSSRSPACGRTRRCRSSSVCQSVWGDWPLWPVTINSIITFIGQWSNSCKKYTVFYIFFESLKNVSSFEWINLSIDNYVKYLKQRISKYVLLVCYIM